VAGLSVVDLRAVLDLDWVSDRVKVDARVDAGWGSRGKALVGRTGRRR
jgi:hypothetical protein